MLRQENNKLGEFTLSGLPPMPRGMPQIEITYDLDANGILSVNAVEKSSGKSQKITIKNESNRLSKEDVERSATRVLKAKEKSVDDYHDQLAKEYQAGISLSNRHFCF
jgi:L1 cell adhesion molecule like protein